MLFLSHCLLVCLSSATPAEAPHTPWPLPWKPDITYKYIWYFQNEEKGFSTFTLHHDKKKKRITCQGELSHSDKVSNLHGWFISVYKENMEPASYMSGFSGKQGVQKGGDAGIIAFFKDKEIVLQYGNLKGKKETFPRPEEKFYIYGHHAIHHWAFFTPFIDRDKKTIVKVFTPDLRFSSDKEELVSLTFTPEEKERTRGLDATRLSFTAETSKKGNLLFSGKVWIDPKGRMLRYQQTSNLGVLNIWIAKESLKAKSVNGGK